MKEPLTINHLAGGAIIAELNRKLQDAFAALDTTDNPKAVARICLDIKISTETSTEDGNFRKVESTVDLTTPTPLARVEILAANTINTIDGKRAATVDPEDDQLPLPGVADITRKRAALA